MYAIIEIGGRQYNVEKGSRVRCEKLDQEANAIMTIDKVLMLKEGENMQIGRPHASGAEVKAKVVANGRGKKIVVLKYKNKTNYRRKYGHRQYFTSLLIEDIKG